MYLELSVAPLVVFGVVRVAAALHRPRGGRRLGGSRLAPPGRPTRAAGARAEAPRHRTEDGAVW